MKDMRSKEHIEWRYFSNIGKSSSRRFTSINKGTRTKFYSIASAALDEDIDRIELEPSTVLINMARRAASAPVRMGNVTETINRLARRLVFYDRFWQSKRQSFLRFLLSSLATFYKSAISSYKADELAHDEAFEDEIGGDIERGLYESDEEFVETFEDEAKDHRARAILMTRQFAAFLVTTYIAFFANKYISAVQDRRLPQEQIDKVMQSYVNKLIQSLGLHLISRDVKRLIMPLRMLLQYYISDYNIAPVRFKVGQEVLSQIIELLVKVVVEAVDESGFYSNRSRKNKYYSSEAILDSYRESILSDEFENYEDDLEDDLGDDLDESLEEGTYEFQEDDDFVEGEDTGLGGTYDDTEEDLGVGSLYEEPFEYEEPTYPDDSELDEYEEFAKLFLSIRPRYSSILFSKNFVKSKKTNSVRMFSNKYFTEELARALYKEFRKLFSSEEEAKEAAEQATLVVEKAAIEGLVESLQEAAAKAAELVQEQAESEKGESEDESENWWDSFIEETDEEGDTEKEEGEEDEGEEDEGEDSGEGEKEESGKDEESKEDESDEEDVKESRLWLYSKRKKKNKILSKYNRRNVKQNRTRYETR